MRTAVIIVMFGMLFSIDVEGCQCGGLPSPEEAEARASSVFKGRVVAKWPVLLRLPWPSEGTYLPAAEWTFDVSKNWKGDHTIVKVLQGPSNCSQIFSLGKEYLVFAYPHETVAGALYSDKCGTPNASEDAVIAALGPPTAVSDPQLAQESRVRAAIRHWYTYGLTGVAAVLSVPIADNRNWLALMPVALFILLLLLAIGLLVFYILRRRSRLYGVLSLSFLLAALVTLFSIGYHYAHTNSLAHLVEHYCQGCEEG